MYGSPFAPGNQEGRPRVYPELHGARTSSHHQQLILRQRYGEPRKRKEELGIRYVSKRIVYGSRGKRCGHRAPSRSTVKLACPATHPRLLQEPHVPAYGGAAYHDLEKAGG
ncbi:hypothetical protein ACJJTC_019501 [Scirpophaga incertulas]